MSGVLEQLAHICRSGQMDAQVRPAAQPSGFAALDAVLPGGGWPMGAIAELMPDTPGIGELSLLMPALKLLAHAGRLLAWITPPYLPYAPGLLQHELPLERVFVMHADTPRESLWVAEQTLRSPLFGAVLLWPAQILDRSIRRLQLAAAAGGSLGVLYRSAQAASTPSPAALRLRLHAAEEGLCVDVHKSRGGRSGLRLHCAVAHPH